MIIALLLVGTFLAGYMLTKPKPCGASCGQKIANVNAKEFLDESTRDGAILIDVRTKDEFDQGHITGSLNADFNNSDQFASYLESLDKKAKYLVYCRSGNRSGQAVKMMEQKGFTNLTNLTGGIQSWTASGYELTK